MGVAVPTGSGIPGYLGCIHWVALITKGANEVIVGGVGGMCPQENFDIYILSDHFCWLSRLPLLILQDIFSAAEGLL